MALVESLLRRDRVFAIAGLTGVTALAWVYLLSLARDMNSAGMAAGIAMPRMQPWSGATDFLLLSLMWAVMMVAMMLPSAAPMILLFATVNRKRRQQRGPFVPTAVFLLGYLLVWGGFSLVGASGTWGLHAAATLSPVMAATSPLLGGALLLAAGIYQLTPLKRVCLVHCRSPMDFVMTHWREGRGGAVIMGLRHGSYCLGCCWALMGLLFVAGVMNLLWVATIAGFVLAEKVAPRGLWISRASAVLLIGWAVWMVAGAVS